MLEEKEYLAAKSRTRFTLEWLRADKKTREFLWKI